MDSPSPKPFSSHIGFRVKQPFPLAIIGGGTALSLLVACHPAPSEPTKTSPPTAKSDLPLDSDRDSMGQEGADSDQAFRYEMSKMAVVRGCCDGSAAVALDNQHYLVANDETSVLRVYHRNRDHAPLLTFDVRKFLDLKKKDAESDIEGMTRIGSIVYVIASHARDKDGDKRKERRQLFGLEYTLVNGSPHITPLGEPYTKLIKDLDESSQLKALDLQAAAGRSGDDQDGFNIEGLSSTTDRALLIGLRSPFFKGKTILLRLDNPREILFGARANLRPATHLIMGGMGIRAMERFETTYLLASEVKMGKTSYPQLFRWDGNSIRPERISIQLPQNLNPESILIFPDTGLTELHLLSDDGNERISPTDDCNDLKKDDERYFRRAVLTLEQIRH